MSEHASPDGQLKHAEMLQVSDGEGICFRAEVDRMEDGTQFVAIHGGDQELYLCNVAEAIALRDWLNKVIP